VGDVCRSCAAPIFWALTTTGTRMPIDAEPAQTGNITVVSDDDGHHLAQVHRWPTDEWPRYTSHFQTCPDAAAWRTPRPAQSQQGTLF
jgi:hypothetical protein